MTLGAIAMAAWVAGCNFGGDGFKIRNASSQAGIRGSIVQGGLRIDFESRVSGDVLTSQISLPDGRVLWSYREPSLSSSTLDGPNVVVDGAEQFIIDNNEQMDQMRSLIEAQGAEAAQVFFSEKQRLFEARVATVASLPEAALIRKLALELVSHVASSQLVAERRGLETAFQALQHAYLSGYPAETTAKSADYFYSSETGYIVLTQHPRAHFRHNLETSPTAHPHSHSEQDGSTPYDDGSQVGDCFGHCGAGCTNDFGGCTYGDWSHVGVTDWAYVGPGGVQCGACIIDGYRTCIYYDAWQRTSWHTFRGAVAEGCIAHDGCCRNSPFGCFDPVCILLMPFALTTSCCCSWPESWSYLGPEAERRVNHMEREDCDPSH